MRKIVYVVMFVSVVLMLAACGTEATPTPALQVPTSAVPGAVTTQTGGQAPPPVITAGSGGTVETVTPVEPTTPQSGGDVGTPVVGVGQSGGTSVPLTAMPVASIQPEASATAMPAISADELKAKVKLYETYNVFWCDPLLYPISRVGDMADQARQNYPEIEKNPDELNSILKKNNLPAGGSLSDDQKVTVYMEHRKLIAIPLQASGGGYTFQLSASDQPGGRSGFRIEGTIDKSGSIKENKREAAILDCPICLAGDTRIDTPNGPVAVKDLREGIQVWTTDVVGKRVAAPIVKTIKRQVPDTHMMVHLVMQDGRELYVSPGHPTTQGKAIGTLSAGEMLDGARIAKAEQVTYTEGATYDILPAGSTGFYWANGILIGSTLR